jgi:hypothetical protein
MPDIGHPYGKEEIFRRTDESEEEKRLLLFDQTPPFLLNAAFCGIEE